MTLNSSTVRVAESFMSKREDMNRSSKTDTQDLRVTDANAEGEDVLVRYCKACSAHDVKPNSLVKKVLSAYPVSVKLQHALIGDRGALAVADCLRGFASLTSLDLRSNSLRNKGTIAICNSLLYHPSLSVLDLRQNAFSIGAKHSLLHLAACNTGVLKQLLIMPNDLNMAVQDAINRILQSDKSTTTLSSNSEFLLHKKLSNSGDLSTVDSTTELSQPSTPTQEMQEVVQGWSISIVETGPNVLWDSPRPSRDTNGSNNNGFPIESSERQSDSQIGGDLIVEPTVKEEAAAPPVDTEDTFSDDGLIGTSDLTQAMMNRVLLDGSFDQRRHSLQTVDGTSPLASPVTSATAKGICQEIYRKSVSELAKRTSSTMNQVEGASALAGADVDLGSDLTQGLIQQDEPLYPISLRKQNTFALEGDLESREKDRCGTGSVIADHVRLLDGRQDQPKISAESVPYGSIAFEIASADVKNICQNIYRKSLTEALKLQSEANRVSHSEQSQEPNELVDAISTEPLAAVTFRKQNTFALEGDLESRQKDRCGTGNVIPDHVRLLDGYQDQRQISVESTSPHYLSSGLVLVHRLSREVCRTIVDKAVVRALSTETNVPLAEDTKPKKPKREKILYSQRSLTDASVLLPMMSESLLDAEIDSNEEDGNGEENGSTITASDVLSPIYRKSLECVSFRDLSKTSHDPDIPFDEEQIQALHHALTLALEGIEKPTSPRRKMTMLLPIDEDAREKDITP